MTKADSRPTIDTPPGRRLAAFARSRGMSRLETRLRRLAAATAALLLGVAGAAHEAAAQVRPLDLRATHAIVIDAETGQTLLAKNADEAIPPASMSKLMTAAMVFEAVEQGRFSLDDAVPVSERAYQKEGSTMFLNLTDTPTIGQLLRGVIVQSGNDACIALAEALSGTEESFARYMTQRAPEIGLEQSRFANATGLPDPDHLMSVRDLATLALYIIREFPDLYPIYSERSFEWAGVSQPNRNPLLYLNIGGDGLKTGHTEEAGYGMVGSAVQDGRRVVAVIAGLPDQQSRSREIGRVFSWAFGEFENRMLVKAGETVAEAEVWIGASKTVALTSAEDIRMSVPAHGVVEPTATIRYEGPVAAPIEKGQPIGVLSIAIEGLGERRTRLVAAESVAQGGYLDKLQAGAAHLAGLAASRIAATIKGDAEETEATAQ